MDFHWRFSFFFRNRKWKVMQRGKKCIYVHQGNVPFLPGCKVSLTAFPVSVAEMLQQEQFVIFCLVVAHLLQGGWKQGEREENMSTLVLQILVCESTRFLQSYIIVLVCKIDLITFSACNLIFSLWSSDSSWKILINQLEFFTHEFLLSVTQKQN